MEQRAGDRADEDQRHFDQQADIEQDDYRMVDRREPGWERRPRCKYRREHFHVRLDVEFGLHVRCPPPENWKQPSAALAGRACSCPCGTVLALIDQGPRLVELSR